MKKITIHFLITGILFSALFIYGRYERSFHKELDISGLEEFYVGLLPDELVERQVPILQNDLPDSRYILQVSCMEEMQFQFSCGTQKVKIEHVFQGDDLEAGDEINILVSTLVSLPEAGGAGENACNLDFVNRLRVGETYLIFLDQKVETENGLLYMQNDHFLVKPYFSYDHIQKNYFASTNPDPDNNSILYKDVKDEEMFLMSEDSVNMMMDLKKELFQKYPKQEAK